MNNSRWIFFLTETGHPPTATSEKILLDSIFKDEESRKIRVRTFGGADWNKADRLANNLKSDSIVVVLTKEESGYGYSAIEGTDNIDLLSAFLHANHRDSSYKVARKFVENQR